MKNTKSLEYENFERAMQKLIKVPHGEIKARLEEEKATKKRKKSKASA